MNVIECTSLTKSYRKAKAINDLTFHIEENKITGLIGRNGAGKTTLLKLIAGFLRPTSGDITVFAERPFNHLKVASNLIFIDDQMVFPTALDLAETLEVVSRFYPKWDMELAQRLFEYFSFHPQQSHSGLSKGMKSTFNMIIGLAARCALTILDEPTTGMDSAVRKDFYKALLKDYIEYPRTIILSSHLLGEVEDILEDILLLRDGQKILHLPVADVREMAIGLRGNIGVLEELTKDKEILHKHSLGNNSSYVVVKNDFTEPLLQRVKEAGIETSPVGADDLCVYLSSKKGGGIEDVFNQR